MSISNLNVSKEDTTSTLVSNSVVCNSDMSEEHENVSLSSAENLQILNSDKINEDNATDHLCQDLNTDHQSNLNTPINSNATLDVANESDRSVSDNETVTREIGHPIMDHIYLIIPAVVLFAN